MFRPYYFQEDLPRSVLHEDALFLQLHEELAPYRDTTPHVKHAAHAKTHA